MAENRGKVLIVSPDDENKIAYVEPDIVFTLNLGTIVSNNIPLLDPLAPEPIFFDSGINITDLNISGVNEIHCSNNTVSIINNDLNGIKLFNNDIGTSTQFNMPVDSVGTYEYQFKILDEPRITLYTASNIDSGEIWLHGGDAGSGSYIGLKVSNLSISDDTVYTLPTNIASTDGEVLICSNTTAELSWTPLNHPSSFIIPWTSFEWFVLTGGADLYNATADAENGTAFAGTPNRTFGAGVSFIIPVSGTWRFTVNFKTGNNCGIATFLIDGTTTAVDTYTAGNEAKSYTWTQNINAGERNVVLSSLTKNGSSSDYWLLPMYNGITVIKE